MRAPEPMNYYLAGETILHGVDGPKLPAGAVKITREEAEAVCQAIRQFRTKPVKVESPPPEPVDIGAQLEPIEARLSQLEQIIDLIAKSTSKVAGGG